jgi:hypothetical protein
MKKTRLLEIVREEIASALNKLNESSDSYLDKNQLNEKPNIDGPLDYSMANNLYQKISRYKKHYLQ